MLAFFTRSGALQGVASHRGGFIFFISELKFSEYRRLTFAYDHTPANVFDEIFATLSAGQETTHKALGFEAAAGACRSTRRGPAAVSTVPDPILVPGGPDPSRAAAAWLRLTRADRRVRKGHCPDCGYDLRGAAGRCPECGKGAPVQ